MALIKLTLRVFPVAVQMGNIPPSFLVCAEFVCVSVCKRRHEKLEERKKEKVAMRGSCLQGPLMVNVDQSGVSGLDCVKM